MNMRAESTRSGALPPPIPSAKPGLSIFACQVGNSLWAVLALLSMALGLAGMVYLAWYKKQEGRSGSVVPLYPEESSLSRSPDRPTLVLFAHPKCPCTSATLQELARLMTVCRDKISAQVLFVMPPGLSHGWTQTSLAAQARTIPGVEVLEDWDGMEARRFGALTSGYVLLYDAQGHLLFRGGITSMRGHEGDNPGLSALISRASGHEQDLVQTPVYGCALFGQTTP